MLVKRGRPGYGVGIMKFEGQRYPLPPGDAANPTSYPFPVLVREIPHVRTNPSPPLIPNPNLIDRLPMRIIVLLTAPALQPRTFASQQIAPFGSL